MLLSQPFAGAEDLQPGAVDQHVQRPARQRIAGDRRELGSDKNSNAKIAVNEIPRMIIVLQGWQNFWMPPEMAASSVTLQRLVGVTFARLGA